MSSDASIRSRTKPRSGVFGVGYRAGEPDEGVRYRPGGPPRRIMLVPKDRGFLLHFCSDWTTKSSSLCAIVQYCSD